MDADIDHTRFSCCGNEELVFLRCEPCGHIWVECVECSTWYVNLDDPKQQERARSEAPGCPACDALFQHRFYLHPDHMAGYLATRHQVLDAGFGRYLCPSVI